MKAFLPLLLVFLLACQSNHESQQETDPPIDMDQVYAWCIVPFDAKERSPQQRIDMLQGLGITQYAYDWRPKHLVEMESEWALAQAAGIDINAVWMWIDDNQDSVGALSVGNEQVLQALANSGLQTQLWVGFAPNYLEGLSDASAVDRGADMLRYLNERLDGLPVKIGLYNHGDWFGDPLNQIKLIQALPEYEMGIVYSFHHAHEQLAEFPAMVDAMLPYLWAVNLDGIKPEGPKILPLGQGTEEAGMISLLQRKGYEGPWGILGHVEEADVEVILRENLQGLRKIMSEAGS